MSVRQTVTFQEALDIVGSLPQEDQEVLIEIIRHRLVEYRREKLAKNISKAREEYDRGEIRRGTVEELMKELSE